MKKPNVSFDEWKNELQAQLTKIPKHQPTPTITDEDAREYYDDNATPDECITAITEQQRPRESEE